MNGSYHHQHCTTIILVFGVASFLLQGKRFSAHDGLKNRRLLWHGTNVAVVAAILKTGLRIMPHSGGRVGKGMYFASENSKSAGYGESLWYFVNTAKHVKGDRSDKATNCSRGPLQSGPRDVILSRMTLDKATNCSRGPLQSGPKRCYSQSNDPG